MEGPSAENVAITTDKVAQYGGGLAVVFHNYALSAERIPRGFEGAVNVLDATVATLKQLLGLLDRAAGTNSQDSKKLFSHEGLTYVQLLATECAATLAKVEPIVADACLNRMELRAKRKLEKKPVT